MKNIYLFLTILVAIIVLVHSIEGVIYLIQGCNTFSPPISFMNGCTYVGLHFVTLSFVGIFGGLYFYNKYKESSTLIYESSIFDFETF